MKIQLVGQVTEVYKSDESPNQYITISDMETGGIVKITAGPGLAVKEGQHYKFNCEVKGSLGKGFRFFLSFQSGAVQPLKASYTEA